MERQAHVLYVETPLRIRRVGKAMLSILRCCWAPVKQMQIQHVRTYKLTSAFKFINLPLARIIICFSVDVKLRRLLRK